MNDKNSPILLVDDDELHLKLLVKALTIKGLNNICTASSAADALKKICAEGVRLIVSDWDMPPGISGLAFLKEIRRDPTLQEIPVILMSGYVDCERRWNATDAGVSHFLEKPLDLGELVAKIEALLSS